ncbi:MAG TPA: organic hydroperoxide resistance protein [Actinomycetota bacterium]|jgi:Ohr subfamily peroxiredoxin|nr:organic hydroperoxide resistance protein [Actinomycetota bacterium]
MQPLYTAEATAVGGRQGHVRSSDGVVDLDLAFPKELGGPGGARSNPEQLFAACYAACFQSALAAVARGEGTGVDDSTVTGRVGIGRDDTGFAVQVELVVSIPGVERSHAEALVHKAHELCPYSKATRGNIDVTLTVT